MAMLSNRPYLLRAFFEWIVDSSCTPILVVDANNPHCKIPREYVEGGEIVFNISSSAVRDLKMSADLVEFKASFSGVIHFVSVPVNAALAVYAEENGEGIFFDGDEEEGGESIEGAETSHIKREATHAGLTPLVGGSMEQGTERPRPILKLVE